MYIASICVHRLLERYSRNLAADKPLAKAWTALSCKARAGGGLKAAYWEECGLIPTIVWLYCSEEKTLDIPLRTTKHESVGLRDSFRLAQQFCNRQTMILGRWPLTQGFIPRFFDGKLIVWACLEVLLETEDLMLSFTCTQHVRIVARKGQLLLLILYPPKLIFKYDEQLSVTGRVPSHHERKTTIHLISIVLQSFSKSWASAILRWSSFCSSPMHFSLRSHWWGSCTGGMLTIRHWADFGWNAIIFETFWRETVTGPRQLRHLPITATWASAVFTCSCILPTMLHIVLSVGQAGGFVSSDASRNVCVCGFVPKNWWCCFPTCIFVFLKVYVLTAIDPSIAANKVTYFQHVSAQVVSAQRLQQAWGSWVTVHWIDLNSCNGILRRQL